MLICEYFLFFIIIELYIVLFYFVTDILTDFCIVDRYFLLYLSFLLLFYYYYYYYYYYYIYFIFIFSLFLFLWQYL